jgi:hypothetical protein
MPKVTDANDFRRIVAGLCLIAAPLVLLLGFLIHPGAGEAGLVQTIAEYPGRVEAANLAIIISSILFVPALLGLLRPVHGRGVMLAHVGVALALLGVIGHAIWAGMLNVLVGMVQSGIDREELSAMADVLDRFLPGTDRLGDRPVEVSGISEVGGTLHRSGSPVRFSSGRQQSTLSDRSRARHRRIRRHGTEVARNFGRRLKAWACTVSRRGRNRCTTPGAIASAKPALSKSRVG